MISRKYKIPIDFDLCNNQEGNEILKSILDIAISKLLTNIPVSMIKDIQLTGSLANGEGTVIMTESRVIASDIDVVVYMSFPRFIIAAIKGLFERLSQEVNSYLSAKGLETHVCFTGSTRSAVLFSYIGESHIYDYEFAANKSLFNKEKSIEKRKVYLPTKKDALQLTFTTVADYMFLDSIASSDMKKIYLLAKRVLTLIHAMLIFEGKPNMLYGQRISFVKRAPACLTFLSTRELEIIRKLTDFKLSGQISYIFDAFQSKDAKQIINLQKKFLADMITKTLFYQLEELYGVKESYKQELTNNQRSSQNKKLLGLINAYFNKTSKSSLNNLIYAYSLAFISLITRRPLTARLIGPLFALRHSLTDVANYMVSLMFLSNIGSQKKKCTFTYLKSIVSRMGIQMKNIEEIWYKANQIKYLP